MCDRRCDLQVIIKRNSTSFFFKALFITILCVFVSMITAANLHPEDQMGDRFAVLFIAILVLAFNFSLEVLRSSTTTTDRTWCGELTSRLSGMTFVFAARARDRHTADVG
jgi:hypothetical protein